MNCLHINQIYLYLEGELSLSETRSIKNHLSSCEKCRMAVEERRLLLEASQDLPSWEIPQDFTRRILEQIFPKKITFREWAITGAIGLSSAALAFLAVYLISGQNLASLFINLNQTAINLFRNMIVFLVKAAKLISIGFQVIQKIGSLIIKGLTDLTSVLGPELQIGLIVLFLVITALLFYGAKRKFLFGEKA
jgi:predicted anti-sigma-YlaC factor YlaD